MSSKEKIKEGGSFANWIFNSQTYSKNFRKTFEEAKIRAERARTSSPLARVQCATVHSEYVKISRSVFYFPSSKQTLKLKEQEFSCFPKWILYMTNKWPFMKKTGGVPHFKLQHNNSSTQCYFEECSFLQPRSHPSREWKLDKTQK